MSANPARTMTSVLPVAGSALEYPDTSIASRTEEELAPPAARVEPRVHTIH